MKVAEYDAFVNRTDQNQDRSVEDRRAIALYGLVGEIGSLITAVKKRLIGESGQLLAWDHANEEVVEEIGDTLWYCFYLSRIESGPNAPNIFVNDIAALRLEVGGDDARGSAIRAILDPQCKETFLQSAEKFSQIDAMTFDNYQNLAFLTARTKGRDLLEVCLAVLSQLGAELLRATMPAVELELNKNIADRPIKTLLGEVAWHLSAIASLMNVSLDSVIEKNVEKLSFRAIRDVPTPLHDEDRRESERFPRVFEISFTTVGPGRSRMYFRGKQFGNELTDNSREDDGYRFHDVFHLANVAHLGWSPVVRKAMKRKRKSRDDQADEVEDGARAEIVEEVVLKAIHTEGVRLAGEADRCDVTGPVRTFPSRGLITFQFLKTIRNFVKGLEVWKNQYWEWDNAILEGADAYYQLRKEGQGTVRVDMDARKLTFSHDVCIDLKGIAVGLGIGAADLGSTESAGAILSSREMAQCPATRLPEALAAKKAILASLGFEEEKGLPYEDIAIKLLGGNRVAVTAINGVRQKMWDTGAVAFQLAFARESQMMRCTAMAVADVASATE